MTSLIFVENDTDGLVKNFKTRGHESRFFAYHPRTYPKELIALWGPWYVRGPLALRMTLRVLVGMTLLVSTQSDSASFG